MDKFENKVKELFCNLMESDACDLAECIFTSVEEKRNFIQNSWNDYGDDIVAFVEGNGSDDEFLELPRPVQETVVIEAIKANFESIFDKPFDE